MATEWGKDTAFTASEPSTFIGRNLLIAPIDDSQNVIKTNKLAGITETVISLNKLNNSDNLEDGKPTNVLLKHHMTSSEEFTNYEPVISQFKKLKNGEFTSITLTIIDQKKNIMTDGPATTLILQNGVRKYVKPRAFPENNQRYKGNQTKSNRHTQPQ